MNNNKEKKRRFDIIFGISLASTLGVILSLFSNLYYDLFVTKKVVWGEVNHNHVVVWFAILLAVWGFFSFLLYDYKNDLEMNVSFWRRFVDYFFKSFKPVRFLRVLVGVYLMLFSIAIIFVFSVIIFSIFERINIYLAIIAVPVWIISMSIFTYKKIFKSK